MPSSRNSKSRSTAPKHESKNLDPEVMVHQVDAFYKPTSSVVTAIRDANLRADKSDKIVIVIGFQSPKKRSEFSAGLKKSLRNDLNILEHYFENDFTNRKVVGYGEGFRQRVFMTNLALRFPPQVRIHSFHILQDPSYDDEDRTLNFLHMAGRAARMSCAEDHAAELHFHVGNSKSRFFERHVKYLRSNGYEDKIPAWMMDELEKEANERPPCYDLMKNLLDEKEMDDVVMEYKKYKEDVKNFSSVDPDRPPVVFSPECFYNEVLRKELPAELFSRLFGQANTNRPPSPMWKDLRHKLQDRKNEGENSQRSRSPRPEHQTTIFDRVGPREDALAGLKAVPAMDYDFRQTERFDSQRFRSRSPERRRFSRSPSPRPSGFERNPNLDRRWSPFRQEFMPPPRSPPQSWGQSDFDNFRRGSPEMRMDPGIMRPLSPGLRPRSPFNARPLSPGFGPLSTGENRPLSPRFSGQGQPEFRQFSPERRPLDFQPERGPDFFHDGRRRSPEFRPERLRSPGFYSERRRSHNLPPRPSDFVPENLSFIPGDVRPRSPPKRSPPRGNFDMAPQRFGSPPRGPMAGFSPRANFGMDRPVGSFPPAFEMERPRSRSPSLRRRSPSPRSWAQSPPRMVAPPRFRSPRRRSPLRRFGSPPNGRNSPSPRRSPQQRFASPAMNRRSPSPRLQYRSPPLRRFGSPPINRRSPSPRRSPLSQFGPPPTGRRSPSPRGFPMQRFGSPPSSRRSPSPRRSRFGSPFSSRRSPSPRGVNFPAPQPSRRRGPSPMSISPNRSPSRDQQSIIMSGKVDEKTLSGFFLKYALSKNLPAVFGGDMMLTWRMAGQNEQSLRAIVEQENTQSKNVLRMRFMKELMNAASKDIPETVNISEVCDETVNFFLDNPGAKSENSNAPVMGFSSIFPTSSSGNMSNPDIGPQNPGFNRNPPAGPLSVPPPVMMQQPIPMPLPLLPPPVGKPPLFGPPPSLMGMNVPPPMQSSLMGAPPPHLLGSPMALLPAPAPDKFAHGRDNLTNVPIQGQSSKPLPIPTINPPAGLPMPLLSTPASKSTPSRENLTNIPLQGQTSKDTSDEKTKKSPVVIQLAGVKKNRRRKKKAKEDEDPSQKAWQEHERELKAFEQKIEKLKEEEKRKADEMKAKRRMQEENERKMEDERNRREQERIRKEEREREEKRRQEEEERKKRLEEEERRAKRKREEDEKRRKKEEEEEWQKRAKQQEEEIEQMRRKLAEHERMARKRQEEDERRKEEERQEKRRRREEEEEREEARKRQEEIFRFRCPSPGRSFRSRTPSPPRRMLSQASSSSSSRMPNINFDMVRDLVFEVGAKRQEAQMSSSMTRDPQWDAKMFEWDGFQHFMVRKMASLPAMFGMSVESISSFTKVIQRLLVHGGLTYQTVRVLFQEQGGQFIRGMVVERLQPFKDSLTQGITVDYIVTLLLEYLTSIGR